MNLIIKKLTIKNIILFLLFYFLLINIINLLKIIT